MSKLFVGCSVHVTQLCAVSAAVNIATLSCSQYLLDHSAFS